MIHFLSVLWLSPLHLSLRFLFASFGLFSFVCLYKHTCLVLTGLTRRWLTASLRGVQSARGSEKENERAYWQTVRRFKCHSSYLSTSECVFNPYHTAAASTHTHTHTYGDRRPKQIYLLWAPLYYFFSCLTHRKWIIWCKRCDSDQTKERFIQQNASHNFQQSDITWWAYHIKPYYLSFINFWAYSIHFKNVNASLSLEVTFFCQLN